MWVWRMSLGILSIHPFLYFHSWPWHPTPWERGKWDTDDGYAEKEVLPKPICLYHSLITAKVSEKKWKTHEDWFEACIESEEASGINTVPCDGSVYWWCVSVAPAQSLGWLPPIGTYGHSCWYRHPVAAKEKKAYWGLFICNKHWS